MCMLRLHTRSTKNVLYTILIPLTWWWTIDLQQIFFNELSFNFIFFLFSSRCAMSVIECTLHSIFVNGFFYYDNHSIGRKVFIFVYFLKWDFNETFNVPHFKWFKNKKFYEIKFCSLAQKRKQIQGFNEFKKKRNI